MSPAVDWTLLALTIWLIGAGISALVLIARHRAAMRSLGELTADETDTLRTGKTDIGPAVVGVLSPRIVLPGDFEARYDETERGAILAHERAHIDGRHVMAKALAQGLACLNWFNPLVHLAAAAVSVDQEMACDEVVVGKDPSVRKVYAKALLKTQTACVLPLGCYWPAHSSKLLRRPVRLVCAGAKGAIPRAVAFGLIAVLAVGGMVSAWAAQPPRVVDFPDARVEIVALPAATGAPAPAPGVRDAALVASSIRAGRARDVLVAGGTATEAADALRQDYRRKGWAATMKLLPVRGSERFASFEDGEFGIAGKNSAGKLVMVNDASFDEYPHPAGLPQATTTEVVRSGRLPARKARISVRHMGIPERITAAVPAVPEPGRLAAFAANDSDRDGKLDPVEYMGVLKTLGFTDQFSANWPRRDVNRDGVVTFEEYRLPLDAPPTASSGIEGTRTRRIPRAG